MVERPPNRRIESKEERFERLKRQVRSGNYKIDPEKVADGILQTGGLENKTPGERQPAPQITIENDAIGRPHVLKRVGFDIAILGRPVNPDHPKAIAEYDSVTGQTHHYECISERQAKIVARFLKSKLTEKLKDRD